MPDFAVYTDKMGINQSVPKMLLSEVFLAGESRNVHDEYGEIRRVKGRIPLLYDADGNKVQTPILAYSITYISTTAKKFVISSGISYAITAVNTGSKTFTVAGNHKTAIDAAIAASAKTEVYGSTGNDGAYTFVSATNSGPNTNIVVSEAIPDGTADGTIFFGSVAKKAAIEAVIQNNQIRVNGSTGNDKLYTVSSITDVGGSTEIVVTTVGGADLPDATIDGKIFAGATPVICYHTYTKEDTQADYLLVGTAYHVWYWDDTNKYLLLKFTSGSPSSVERMEMVTHLDRVYMTNNVDMVQWWDTTSLGNVFAKAGSASGILVTGSTYIIKAKHIYSFESYLFLGFVTYTGNSIFPLRAHWSGRGTVGATLDFDAGGVSDTGYKDFNRDPSQIVGFASKGTDLIVAKGERMVRGWLVSEDTVFEWVEEAIKVGCISGKTLVNDRAGRLYWLASDFTLREMDTADPISFSVEKTMRTLNPSVAEFAQATYIDEFGEVWFAVPTEDSDTNNLVISFNVNTTKIYLHDIPIRAFCGYRRQVIYGYDTLPYRTYEAWGIAWLVYDTKVNAIGYPLDIAADYNGNTFELHRGDKDDSATWTGTMVFSTTLTPGKSPYIYKRVANGIDITVNSKEAGTASISVKKDGEKSWSSVGTVSFTPSDEEEFVIVHVPFDKRARVFYIKIESSSDLEFIGAVFREFYMDGDR